MVFITTDGRLVVHLSNRKDNHSEIRQNSHIYPNKQNSGMTFSLRTTLLIALASLVLGISATHAFWKSDYPGQPLFVKLENMREEVIPTITIEHGNDFSQEKIIITQLQPGE
ncbi:MAG: Unknown protein, partial [uncultured Thiotrichaceae bacterium]